MSGNDNILGKLKSVLVNDLMLDVTEDEIDEETPLFGPDSLGLDSIDALQLVLAIEKHFGLKISDSEAAKGILESPKTIVSEILKSKS